MKPVNSENWSLKQNATNKSIFSVLLAMMAISDKQQGILFWISKNVAKIFTQILLIRLHFDNSEKKSTNKK